MTAKQKVGWKVLRRNRNSCIISGGHYTRVYLKRRKTTPAPRCGPLCIFERREDAEDFSLPHLIIAKCLYKPSNIKYIWTTRKETKKWDLWKLPEGTALADSVTCLE